MPAQKEKKDLSQSKSPDFSRKLYQPKPEYKPKKEESPRDEKPPGSGPRLGPDRNTFLKN
jgi:hypothetical protein